LKRPGQLYFAAGVAAADIFMLAYIDTTSIAATHRSGQRACWHQLLAHVLNINCQLLQLQTYKLLEQLPLTTAGTRLVGTSSLYHSGLLYSIVYCAAAAAAAAALVLLGQDQLGRHQAYWLQHLAHVLNLVLS
jgi:hypothetical protein